MLTVCDNLYMCVYVRVVTPPLMSCRSPLAAWLQMNPVIRAVEPAACPSLTKGTYTYDYGDTAGTCVRVYALLCKADSVCLVLAVCCGVIVADLHLTALTQLKAFLTHWRYHQQPADLLVDTY